jgi:hypothetical protein
MRGACLLEAAAEGCYRRAAAAGRVACAEALATRGNSSSLLALVMLLLSLQQPPTPCGLPPGHKGGHTQPLCAMCMCVAASDTKPTPICWPG